MNMNIYRFVPIAIAALFAAPALAQVSPTATLEAHNAERANYPGVNPLQWSPALAQFAQDWAERSAARDVLAHRPNRTENPVAPGEYVGENGYQTDGSPGTGPEAVQNWIAEKQWYHHDLDDGYAGYSNSPPGCMPPAGAFCGHFTQVIWKDTRLVGCGRATAQDGSIYIFCNYYPAGNWAGQKPY